MLREATQEPVSIVLPLNEERPTLRGAVLAEQLRDLAQRGVRREEHEEPAVAHLCELESHVRSRHLKRLGAALRTRQVCGHTKHRLRLEIKRRHQDTLYYLRWIISTVEVLGVEPEARSEEIEALARRERRRGQDRRLGLREECVQKEPSEIDGSRCHHDVRALPTSTGFQPAHVRVCLLPRSEHEAQSVHRRRKTSLHGTQVQHTTLQRIRNLFIELDAGPQLGDLPFERAHRGQRPCQSLPNVVALRRLPDPRGSEADTASAGRDERLDRFDEALDLGACARHRGANAVLQPLAQLLAIRRSRQGPVKRRENTFAPPVEPREHAVEAAARDLDTQMRRSGVFDVVCLVQYDPVVRGKDGGLREVQRGVPHREVGEQEVMVHDQQLGGRGPAA